jgi:hypothetical protein
LNFKSRGFQSNILRLNSHEDSKKVLEFLIKDVLEFFFIKIVAIKAVFVD